MLEYVCRKKAGIFNKIVALISPWGTRLWKTSTFYIMHFCNVLILKYCKGNFDLHLLSKKCFFDDYYTLKALVKRTLL